MAFDLYLLTYSNIELDKTVRPLNSKEKQKEHYSRWWRFRYKRLWAALRDYRKATNYLALVQQGLCETFGQEEGKHLYQIWTAESNFSPALLELPGDVWNSNFKEL
ncbi:MAG: hypothetical protein QXP45_02705 [Thermoproteota archaeon]